MEQETDIIVNIWRTHIVQKSKNFQHVIIFVNYDKYDLTIVIWIEISRLTIFVILFVSNASWSNMWYLDNGCFSPMIGRKSLLMSLEDYKGVR